MDTPNTTIWPPPYSVRRSQRARRTFLQVTPATGLEIVVPERLKRFNIEKLLLEKRSWIEKMLARFRVPFLNTQPNAETLTEGFAIPLEKPGILECQALNETWKILYHATPSKRISLKMHTMPEKLLILTGDIDNIPLCVKTLKKWLMMHARTTLIPWLQNLSLQTRLVYNRTTIRGQSTLWGSCNAKKTISLNYKLLFLPASLTKHVLLHELCHLKYLNHSEKFWSFLKSFDEHCMANKKALKLAEHHVPKWLK